MPLLLSLWSAVGAVANKNVTSGTGTSARKLEEETDKFAHATLDKSCGMAIQQVGNRGWRCEGCRKRCLGAILWVHCAVQ